MNNLMTIKLDNELRMIGLFDTLIKIIIMINKLVNVALSIYEII
jgi:hypothetical protein